MKSRDIEPKGSYEPLSSKLTTNKVRGVYKSTGATQEKEVIYLKPEDTPVPIHIPHGNNLIKVYVRPDKTYGNETGQELIKKYKVKHRQPEIPDFLEYDTHLNIPNGELPKKTKIGDRHYDTRKLFELVEQIVDKRIISKRENRALKHMINCSLRLPIIYNQNSHDPLRIIGRDKVYLLTPAFK